jgi:probable rRNA maturation factor
VLLADDRALRRLNATHRGKDKPTNVLSFPAGMPGQLGDIALALGVVRREALAAGRRPAVHFAHLVAHGTLHLLGHDHLDAGEARRMEQAESRIMARLGLPNPWRVGAPGQPLGQFRGMAA